MEYASQDDAFLGELKNLGWKRRASRAWTCEQDAYVLVDVQKSNFGPDWFVNIGVQFHSLSSGDRPRLERCHIQIRANRFFDAFPELAGSTPEEARLIAQEIEPSLKALGQLAEVRKNASEGKFSRGLVLTEARVLIGL